MFPLSLCLSFTDDISSSASSAPIPLCATLFLALPLEQSITTATDTAMLRVVMAAVEGERHFDTI